jgi:hemoglobin
MTTAPLLDDSSLYVRLGGEAVVAAVVDGFYERVLADADLAHYFDGVVMEGLRAHQRAFVAVALGGADRYVGRSVDVAHRGLGVSGVAFAKVVAHLVDTLKALGVDSDDISTIASVLAPLEAHVVSSTFRSTEGP